MLKQGMTINDAAHEWVREFNAVPQDMIARLMHNNPEEWIEMTLKRSGDRVYCYDYNEYGEIDHYYEDTEEYTVKLDNGSIVKVAEDDMGKEEYDMLPMWGTMWQFGDACDEHWLEDYENRRIMSECGFRIYEHEEWGFFFGIDGAGYDFYDAHWIPLYKARGLKWHDEAAEKEYQMLKRGYVKRKLGMNEYWYDGDQAICEA